MKLPFSSNRAATVAISFAASVMLLSGCIESGKFVWNADGTEAAICANDGLRFCDATGKLSDTQLKTPDELAWSKDGKRLFVVTHVDGLTWNEVAAQLPGARRDLVEAQGDLFAKSAQQPGVTAAEFGKQLHGKISHDALNEILLYLKAKHDDELKSVFGKDWNNYEITPASMYTVASYAHAGDKLTDEQIIWRNTKALTGVRPCPTGDGRMLAVQDGRNLYLLGAGGEPILLVEGCSKYCDWSPDGKSVYFFLESSEEKSPDWVAKIDTSKLGPGAGLLKDHQPGDIQKLVALKYYKDSRVRCLPDGRLLLATAEATQKTKPDVFGRKTIYAETFYTLAPGSSIAEQLGHSNEFVNKCGYCSFETSPDSHKVVLATENGSIRVLPALPHAGATKEIAPDNNNPSPFAPCFRTDEELCYASGAPKGDSRDVVLHNLKTNATTNISASWPKTAVAGILIKEEAQQNRFEDFLNALYQ